MRAIAAVLALIAISTGVELGSMHWVDRATRGGMVSNDSGVTQVLALDPRNTRNGNYGHRCNNCGPHRTLGHPQA